AFLDVGKEAGQRGGGASSDGRGEALHCRYGRGGAYRAHAAAVCARRGPGRGGRDRRSAPESRGSGTGATRTVREPSPIASAPLSARSTVPSRPTVPSLPVPSPCGPTRPPSPNDRIHERSHAPGRPAGRRPHVPRPGGRPCPGRRRRVDRDLPATPGRGTACRRRVPGGRRRAGHLRAAARRARRGLPAAVLGRARGRSGAGAAGTGRAAGTPRVGAPRRPTGGGGRGLRPGGR